jgi:2-oxoglutarate ferredoxin oxidoreductase subunit alpha
LLRTVWFWTVTLPATAFFSTVSIVGGLVRAPASLHDWVHRNWGRAGLWAAGVRTTVTGLEHNELGRPNDQPDMHYKMSKKRHDKLLGALDHPGITIQKRFGDKGNVDVGILGWGSTFGEILEAMLMAQDEGISCSAMKVVMLSPLPIQPIRDFFSDSREILIPELNYEGQFANLVGSAISEPLTRLNRVPGVPMRVADILDEIRRLAEQVKSAA